MADTNRDKLMRLVGRLHVAQDLAEHAEVPYDMPEVSALTDSAAKLLRQAMMQVWQTADMTSEAKNPA